MNNTQFRQDFYARLPKKPYCSENLGYGLIIRPKKMAIQMPYIQHNQPCLITSLVFDVDRSDAFFTWSDANLPQPHWITQNKQNYHAHLGYLLATPVCTSHRAKRNIIEYLAKIEQAYRLALGADNSYSGLVTKNPCHRMWKNYSFNIPHYDLNYLADFVELEELNYNYNKSSGLGRNCILFDDIRYWAYKAIREHLGGSFDDWYRAVLESTEVANNSFSHPLPYSEVKSISKSISKWVWRNHSEAHAKFIERQSIKGKVGAVIANTKGACSFGGLARSQSYNNIRQEALKLHLQGINNSQIAIQLNVSRRTIIRWLNGVTVPS